MSDGEKKSGILPRGPNVSTRRGRVPCLNTTNREFSWGGRVARTLARLLIRVLQCSQAFPRSHGDQRSISRDYVLGGCVDKNVDEFASHVELHLCGRRNCSALLRKLWWRRTDSTHGSADMRRRHKDATERLWFSLGPQIGPRQFESDPLNPSDSTEAFELIGENLLDAPGLEPGTPCM